MNEEIDGPELLTGRREESLDVHVARDVAKRPALHQTLPLPWPCTRARSIFSTGRKPNPHFDLPYGRIGDMPSDTAVVGDIQNEAFLAFEQTMQSPVMSNTTTGAAV